MKKIKQQMPGLIIGSIVGSILTILVSTPFVIMEIIDKYEYGLTTGETNALANSVNLLETAFGSSLPEEGLEYEFIYSSKTTAVVSTEINGVKTLRVLR